MYHHAIYEPNPLKGLQIYGINLQHENSQSVTLAFRLGVGEVNFRPVSSYKPYITESIQGFGNNKVLK